MAERAKLFENDVDFDISTFTPKKAPQSTAPPSEALRAVSERAEFTSREPVPPAPKQVKNEQRRRRTGRNLQLNLKVDANTLESFYEITDRQGWVLGETLARAVAALRRELAGKS